MLQRINNAHWLIGLAAKHTCPEGISCICDWTPQFWLAYQEYCQQYKGDILDVRWDCIVMRASQRVQAILRGNPLYLMEGLQ